MTVELDKLPPAAAVLVVWFRRRGFTLHIFGAKNRPDAMVLSRTKGPCIDIAHIFGSHETYVARLPHWADIFGPLWVYDHQYGEVVETFEYLRDLVQSEEEEDYATRELYEPPVGPNMSRSPLLIPNELRIGKRATLAPLGNL